MRAPLPFALPIVAWLVFGAVASLAMSLTVGTRGYFFGLVPGLLVGAILAAALRWVPAPSTLYLLSAVVGSLGLFFCVATLGNPLPVDWEAPWGQVRLPAYVALAGGAFGLFTVELARRLGPRPKGEAPAEGVGSGKERG